MYIIIQKKKDDEDLKINLPSANSEKEKKNSMKLIAEVSIKNRTLYLTVFQHSRHKAARITVINLIKLLCEY